MFGRFLKPRIRLFPLRIYPHSSYLQACGDECAQTHRVVGRFRIHPDFSELKELLPQEEDI